MRKFVVVGYTKNTSRTYSFRSPEGSRFDFVADMYQDRTLELFNLDDNPLNRHCFVRFVDDEAAAISLAKMLAANNTDIAYCVAKVDLVIQTKPAPPVTARMTDKGLIPE